MLTNRNSRGRSIFRYIKISLMAFRHESAPFYGCGDSGKLSRFQRRGRPPGLVSLLTLYTKRHYILHYIINSTIPRRQNHMECFNRGRQRW